MLNNIEEWKSISLVDGTYRVSSLGNIRNTTGLILKAYKLNSGYLAIKLKYNGTRYHKLIHRLVAIAFLDDNLENTKLEVNHIDGDKLNNKLSNLEIVTSSENKVHALSTGLKVYNKPSKGLKIGKTSKYRNVTYDKSKGKYVAMIRVNNKNIGFKSFDSEYEAAEYVNYLIDLYGLDRPKNIL